MNNLIGIISKLSIDNQDYKACVGSFPQRQSEMFSIKSLPEIKLNQIHSSKPSQWRFDLTWSTFLQNLSTWGQTADSRSSPWRECVWPLRSAWLFHRVSLHQLQREGQKETRTFGHESLWMTSPGKWSPLTSSGTNTHADTILTHKTSLQLLNSLKMYSWSECETGELAGCRWWNLQQSLQIIVRNETL